jgi:AcrR family transcriptional regulator
MRGMPGSKGIGAPAAVAAARRRGRPRSSSADRAIAEATIELLASRGFAGLRIERVAERAGVGKTTIYRRWPTKEQLVASALSEFVDEFAVPDSGSSRDDVVVALRYQLGVLTGGFGRVAGSLLSEAAFHPVLARALRGPTQQSRAMIAQILARAIERGELRPALDLGRTIDLLWGPVYYRFLLGLIEEEAVPADYVENVVDDVWPALRT